MVRKTRDLPPKNQRFWDRFSGAFAIGFDGVFGSGRSLKNADEVMQPKARTALDRHRASALLYCLTPFETEISNL